MIDKSAFVHPTAIVEEGASIGANAHIGPFCIVGPHGELINLIIAANFSMTIHDNV
ncbi:hypothetical protein ACUOFC_64260, partial [Escherichia sp. TWPC-MK]